MTKPRLLTDQEIDKITGQYLLARELDSACGEKVKRAVKNCVAYITNGALFIKLDDFEKELFVVKK